MSAVARDYAYIMKIPKDGKDIPVISRERLEEAKKEAAAIRKEQNERKA